MKLFTLIIGLVLFTIQPVLAQSGPLDKISTAIQAGNAKAIAGYFDSNVEMTLPDEDGFYSKAQSEQVLKDFFSKNRPSGFKIMHQGDSGGNSMYAIGTLTTASGSFRTYIFMKEVSGKYVIQQLKFTND